MATRRSEPGRDPGKTRSEREGEVRRPGDGSKANSNPRAGKQQNLERVAPTEGRGRPKPAGTPRRRGDEPDGGPGRTGRAGHGSQADGPALLPGPRQEHRKLTPSGRKRGEDQGQGGYLAQSHPKRRHGGGIEEAKEEE